MASFCGNHMLAITQYYHGVIIIQWPSHRGNHRMNISEWPPPNSGHYTLAITQTSHCGFHVVAITVWPSHSGNHTIWRVFKPYFNVYINILMYITCILFWNLFLCVWALCMHVCLCTICMPGDWGSQKRAWDDPLELEWQLWPAVWVLGIKPASSGKAGILLTSEPSLRPL